MSFACPNYEVVWRFLVILVWVGVGLRSVRLGVWIFGDFGVGWVLGCGVSAWGVLGVSWVLGCGVSAWGCGFGVIWV